MYRFTIISLLVISTVGCASMTSSIMNRSDHDVFSKNSHKKQKGVPVTLSVPTHLKVQIQEEYFLRKNQDTANPHYMPKPVSVDRPILSVDYGFDYEDKIFMVDLKRPAVGTIQTDIQIDPDTQYFRAIKGKVVDNTLREIAQILPQFNVAFATPTSGSIGDAESKLITAKRTVAFTRIDINAVDFEQQLTNFFDKHVNNCNDCQTRQGDGTTDQSSTIQQPEYETIQ